MYQCQIENSKFMWRINEKWKLYVRINEVNIIVPIETWISWNPVDRKKIDPSILSFIQEYTFLYSIIWLIGKYNSKIITLELTKWWKWSGYNLWT